MALVTEDGTGLSTAESYISVASADTRLASLGLTAWAALTTEAKEQALRRATAHMERAYRQRWRGTKLLRAQALSWPRYGASVDGFNIESTVVPSDVANACAELAIKAVTSDLSPDVERAIIREKVGPLETEYSEFGAQSTRWTAIDLMLAPYLFGGGATRVVRA